MPENICQQEIPQDRGKCCPHHEGAIDIEDEDLAVGQLSSRIGHLWVSTICVVVVKRRRGVVVDWGESANDMSMPLFICDR